MENRKTKPALKVVHRNDRAQIKRVLAGSGQALLPMLELLEGAQASIDELMHETAVALVEQLLGCWCCRRKSWQGLSSAGATAGRCCGTAPSAA